MPEPIATRLFTACSLAGLAVLWAAATPLYGVEEPGAVPASGTGAEMVAPAFIPMEREDIYQDLIGQAMKEFEAKRYESALEILARAGELYPRDPFAINLRGAIRTKIGEFEKARTDFQQALEQDPQFFPARFNLGEVLFLEGKHEEALRYFEVLNDNYLRNELIEFKLVVLFAVTGRQDDAQRMVGRMRFPGDTPAWYFANAAVLAAEDKKGDAARYIAAARKLFDAPRTELYEETLAEAKLKP